MCLATLWIASLSSQPRAEQTSSTENSAPNNSQAEKIVAQNKLAEKRATATRSESDTQSESDKLNKHNSAEPISNVSYDGQILTFTVISNGCTSPEHFTIMHQTDADMCQLTITRTQPDYCRRVPQAVEISLPWTKPESTQVMPIQITNPLLQSNVSKQFDK